MPYKVTEINPSRTALIIVDMENDYVAEGAPHPNGLLLFRDELSGWLHTMDRPGQHLLEESAGQRSNPSRSASAARMSLLQCT